jgi:hypothetical protein
VTTPTKSYLKVPYELRPRKQVERRMMVDGLRLLGSTVFPMSEYRYVGMGSISFVDFIMFHKLLGISKLTSVEHSTEIEKRVEFNRPYNCVDIRMASMADAIASLSPDERHILWLDYDYVMSVGLQEDIWQAASRLSVGSILFVTVDVEPPDGEESPAAWKNHYETLASTYLGDRPVADYVRSNLPRINTDIVARAMLSGVASRRGVELIPLFNFLYADGHNMQTIGCMIGSDLERRKVLASGIDREIYYRGALADEPYEIRVPVITRKERAYLDREMPCDDTWQPADFELSNAEVLLYREIYRFLPAYAELLL